MDNNLGENAIRPIALGYAKQMIMQSDTLLFISCQHFNIFNNSYRFT